VNAVKQVSTAQTHTVLGKQTGYWLKINIEELLSPLK